MVRVLQGTQEEWRNVFFMTGGLVTGGVLVYLIFFTSGVEEWARTPAQTEDHELKKPETLSSLFMKMVRFGNQKGTWRIRACDALLCLILLHLKRQTQFVTDFR